MTKRSVLLMIGLMAAGAAVNVCAAAVVWNGPRAAYELSGQCRVDERWCLGTVSVVEQLTASEGGPEALEGFTRVNTRGSVRLALGTIGNIEQAGSGDLIEARSLQAGGVFTGSGRVGRWVGLFIDKPKIKGSGAAVPSAQLPDYRAIQFANGLYLTPDTQDGVPVLKLCPDDPQQAPCLILKP